MGRDRNQLDTLRPLDRETTASIIADRIREAIMQGVLEPGSQLVESELAARFRVSRGPIREATQRLIQEGLLTNERFRGVFVPKLEGAEVQDLYRARRAIERAAVETLTQSHTPERTAALEELVARMRRAAAKNRWAEVASLDLAFHEKLVAASGSPRLVRMFRTLMVETSMCVAALKPAYPRPNALADEHGALLDAIEAEDVTHALRVLDEHLDSAVRDLTTPEPA